ncbi:hypothetical protein BY996DRAFT_7930274 [Phakopsora pachyrhizi]|nr:hypothetical protein BY996DRAFT_8079519 [Phakopsora pachyrhizi]KAI8445703.1 hypothetical protein BY996DRAFT_7930274 [Phakopsora pachyrhizi]
MKMKPILSNSTSFFTISAFLALCSLAQATERTCTYVESMIAGAGDLSCVSPIGQTAKLCMIALVGITFNSFFFWILLTLVRRWRMASEGQSDVENNIDAEAAEAQSVEPVTLPQILITNPGQEGENPKPPCYSSPARLSDDEASSFLIKGSPPEYSP